MMFTLMKIPKLLKYFHCRGHRFDLIERFYYHMNSKEKKNLKNPILFLPYSKVFGWAFVNSVGYILLKYNSAIKTFHRCTYN